MDPLAFAADLSRAINMQHDPDKLVRIKGVIEAYELGCTDTHIADQAPENCPTCTRAFLDALKRQVDS